jgi:hypothetical protein
MENIIQKIVNEYTDGDKESAIAQVKEMKSNNDFFESIAPFFGPRTESLFISSLEDAIRLFLVSPDCKASIANNQDCNEIEKAISNVYSSFIDSSLILNTKELTWNEASMDSVFYLIRSLFEKKIDLGLSASELKLLSDAGIDEIDVQLSAMGDHFSIVEKRDLSVNFKKAFASFADSLMLFASKNITPRTVAVGTIAVSVAMNLLGSPSAHAGVQDAHDLVSSDVMESSLHKISHYLSEFDHTHSSLVKVVANDLQKNALGGVGHFKIEVGDCFVEGSYKHFNTGIGMTEDLTVKSGVLPTNGPVVCKEFAEELSKILYSKMNQLLSK